MSEPLDHDDIMGQLSAALAGDRAAMLVLTNGTVMELELNSVTGWTPEMWSAEDPAIEIRANVTAAHPATTQETQ